MVPVNCGSGRAFRRVGKARRRSSAKGGRAAYRHSRSSRSRCPARIATLARLIGEKGFQFRSHHGMKKAISGIAWLILRKADLYRQRNGARTKPLSMARGFNQRRNPITQKSRLERTTLPGFRRFSGQRDNALHSTGAPNVTKRSVPACTVDMVLRCAPLRKKPQGFQK